MRLQYAKTFTLLVLFMVTSLFGGQADRALAQSRKGSISGHVTDSSGGVLKGAQISIEPQSISTATDVQGQFFINDLDPGSYTLTISYVGFATFTKAVEVTAGQSVNMDATLGLQSDPGPG